jgi:C4-dicarboxylate transporter, DctQ subunit
LIIKPFLKHLDRYFEEYICVFLLALLVSLLGISVFSRFILHRAWAWNEELTHIIFVLFIYFGLSLGAMKRGHIRVTTFVKLFPETWHYGIILIADIVWILFNVAVIIISIELLTTMIDFPYFTAAMHLNMFWIYLIIPLSFLLTNYRIIQYYYRKYRSKKSLEGRSS